MTYTFPSVADFKTYFNRDFPYGTDMNTQVLDTDIAKGILQMSVTINDELFPVGQEQFTIGALLLAAHFMVMNIQTSGQGLSSQNDWLVTSKSVGNVSQGSQIPPRILENPEFASIGMTKYGLQYLTMILPYLSGPFYTVAGRTQA